MTECPKLAITVAKTVAKVPTMDSFVYISASDLFPFVDPRYFSTKREVERYLFAQPEFRSVVLRPGMSPVCVQYIGR